MQENTNLMPKNGNLMQENTNECSSSSTKQHLMVCPICDKKFDADAISAHADQCATNPGDTTKGLCNTLPLSFLESQRKGCN